ncbi:hypothetical protein U9M48_030053 [Paspalum notatum var. saurae]|uniref:Uncharacterized protein n=1 Tax=Paspalum notatum var. saurae TaxID=547442 RepID=A0AAQ3X3C7_PASNO
MTLLSVGPEFLHLICHLDNFDRALLATGDGHVLTLDLGGCGKFLRGREENLPHLDLARTSWEDHKLGLVGLKPLDIGLQALERAVLAAVIH